MGNSCGFSRNMPPPELQPFCSYNVRMERALTLLEVLVVAAILGVLSALIVSSVIASKKAANVRNCAANLRQLYGAVSMYMADHSDTYPAGKDCVDAARPDTWPTKIQRRLEEMPLLSEALFPYARSKAIGECPSDQGLQVIEALFPNEGGGS